MRYYAATMSRATLRVIYFHSTANSRLFSRFARHHDARRSAARARVRRRGAACSARLWQPRAGVLRGREERRRHHGVRR